MWTGIAKVSASFVLGLVVGCDCAYDSSRGVGGDEIVEICTGEWRLDPESRIYCQKVLGYSPESVERKYSFRLLTNGIVNVHCLNHNIPAEDHFFHESCVGCITTNYKRLRDYEKIMKAGGIGRWRVENKKNLTIDTSVVDDWTWRVCCDVLVGDVTYGYEFYLRKDSDGLYLGVPVTTRSGNVSGFICFRKFSENDGR